MSDERLDALRARITAIDREVFALVRQRIETVAELRRHKEEHGLPFLDAARESAMIEERAAENAGALSHDGVRAFYESLLALVKRELG